MERNSKAVVEKVVSRKNHAITSTFSTLKALHPVSSWSLTVQKVHAGLDALAKLVFFKEQSSLCLEDWLVPLWKSDHSMVKGR